MNDASDVSKLVIELQHRLVYTKYSLIVGNADVSVLLLHIEMPQGKFNFNDVLAHFERIFRHFLCSAIDVTPGHMMRCDTICQCSPGECGSRSLKTNFVCAVRAMCGVWSVAFEAIHHRRISVGIRSTSPSLQTHNLFAGDASRFEHRLHQWQWVYTFFRQYVNCQFRRKKQLFTVPPTGWSECDWGWRATYTLNREKKRWIRRHANGAN